MYDLLIIGSGGAGLSAALEAASLGASVAVVSKNFPTQALTCMAQGGLNAALGNIEPDSIEEHIEDTLRSSHGLADEKMVGTLCKAAPETVEWLDRLLVPFSRIEKRRESGKNPATDTVAQRRLGGASHTRACYAQDYTGLKILQTLYDRCLESGIDFYSEHFLLDLVQTTQKDKNTSDDLSIAGADFWDISRGEIHRLEAKATLIATGGFGELYHGYTTNAYGATGDGQAAVLRAGGVLGNMEFVQFHPTALEDSSILISEGVRGAGGYLITENEERFVDELAPRDIVAREIFRQIQAGHKIFLDMRHIEKSVLTDLMPQELHLIRLHAGIDPLEEPVPVIPAVHYTMGGIDIDRNFSVNGLKRVFAAGECTNSHIHGANRLGGNSLLEIVAFGRLAARNALDCTPEKMEKTALANGRGRIERIFDREGRLNLYHKRKILGKRLFHDLGIIRNKELMGDAAEYIAKLQNGIDEIGLADRSLQHNQNLIEYLQFENSLILAEALCKSALWREESRGAHWRSDFPAESERFALESRYTVLRGVFHESYPRNRRAK